MPMITDPRSRIAVSELCYDFKYYGRSEDLVTTVYDAESRKWLKLTGKDVSECVDELGAMTLCFLERAAPMFAAIRKELDAAPPNATALVLTLDGQVLCKSTDPAHDVTPGTHYAPIGDYHIPVHIKTMARDELVEVSRLISFVDIVTPVSSPSLEGERLVFKHYQHAMHLPGIWNSIHIGAILSNHPHICPVRHVVVDETDRSRVVGYTSPFITGGTLESRKSSRTFKLKWAKQLFRTVDDLHLKYGVFHGDLHTDNMIIDTATDNLVLIDFGHSGKIGTLHPLNHLQGALTHETTACPLLEVSVDIQKAVRCVHRLVTGLHSLFFTGSDGLPMPFQHSHIKTGGWVKGANVTLDSPADDYYKAAMEWIRQRNAGPMVTEHSQASEPLNYPDYMPVPKVDIDAYRRLKAKMDALCAPRQLRHVYTDPVVLDEMNHPPFCTVPPITFPELWWIHVNLDPTATSGRYFLRSNAIKAGHSFVSWERPPTALLDPTRRLLANGKYEEGIVDKHPVTSAVKNNKRKREDSVAAECPGDVGTDGSASGGKTDTTTTRLTRSAAKKQREAAAAVTAACELALKPKAVSSPKSTRKAAAPKPTRKAPTPKPARKALTPKPTRKAAATKLTRKVTARKPAAKAPACKGGAAAAASTAKSRVTKGTS